MAGEGKLLLMAWFVGTQHLGWKLQFFAKCSFVHFPPSPLYVLEPGSQYQNWAEEKRESENDLKRTSCWAEYSWLEIPLDTCSDEIFHRSRRAHLESIVSWWRVTNPFHHRVLSWKFNLKQRPYDLAAHDFPLRQPKTCIFRSSQKLAKHSVLDTCKSALWKMTTSPSLGNW